MELGIAVAVVAAAAAVVVVARAADDPARTLSGMWRFRSPGWPVGVQEDDDAHWSWAAPAGEAAPGTEGDEPGDADDAPDAPPGLDVDVVPLSYEVRSADRERS